MCSPIHSRLPATSRLPSTRAARSSGSAARSRRSPARSNGAASRRSTSTPARWRGSTTPSSRSSGARSPPPAGWYSSARAMATSMRWTRRAGRSCGASIAGPAPMPCPFPTWSARSSTSPWAAAATRSSISSAATACSYTRSATERAANGGRGRPRAASFFAKGPAMPNPPRAGLIAGLALLCCCAAQAQDVEAGREKAGARIPCHGPTGHPTDPQFPILAGQTARYIYLQLRDFQEGRRKAPVMEPFVTKLTRNDMLDLAAFFAAQRLRSPDFKVNEARARRGKAKSVEVLCTMCHLGGFLGQNEIPRVAGQHYQYIVKQLQDFKARRRDNDAGNMTAVSRTLSDRDIEDLGHYLAGLR